MSERNDLLQKYASNLPDDRYRNHYVSYARNFLNSAAALDKKSINKYLAKLKRQGKSAGTINFAFRVIRTLFNVNKLDWPFRRKRSKATGFITFWWSPTGKVARMLGTKAGR